MTRVLGIEGTAWCASAAVFDADSDDVRIESDAYAPDSGGIHPREAAEDVEQEHMLERNKITADANADEGEGEGEADADAEEA